MSCCTWGVIIPVLEVVIGCTSCSGCSRWMYCMFSWDYYLLLKRRRYLNETFIFKENKNVKIMYVIFCICSKLSWDAMDVVDVLRL